MSYRLFTAADALGAMNLYSLRTDAFDTEDIYKGGPLPPTLLGTGGAQNVTHMETAISVRTVTGRAVGILMERVDLSPAQAFAVLHRVSQDRNIKLNRAAEELVKTRKTPS